MTAYNGPVQQPAPERVGGYDIVLWIDEDGDTIITPYTEAGRRFIRQLFPTWDPAARTVIIGRPEVFFNTVPEGLAVGAVNPETEMITTVIKKPLH